MNNDVLWVRLALYFANEITTQGNKKVDVWRSHDFDRGIEIHQFYEGWVESESHYFDVHLYKACLKLLHDLFGVIESHSKSKEALLYNGLSSESGRGICPEAFLHRSDIVTATFLIFAMAWSFFLIIKNHGEIFKPSRIKNQAVTEHAEEATHFFLMNLKFEEWGSLTFMLRYIR